MPPPPPRPLGPAECLPDFRFLGQVLTVCVHLWPGSAECLWAGGWPAFPPCQGVGESTPLDEDSTPKINSAQQQQQQLTAHS